MMTRTATPICRKLLFFFIGVILYSNMAWGQLAALYQLNEKTCDCINVFMHNASHDTVFVISQSNSIHDWDSCFAYTIFSGEKFKNRHSLDITYYYRDFDYSPRSYFYILPNSTHKFGARSNQEMINDSLFISMYIYAMPIKKGENMENMKRKLQKLEKSKKVRPWGWRSYYCPQQE